MSAEADSTSLIHTGEQNYIASKSEIICEKSLKTIFNQLTLVSGRPNLHKEVENDEQGRASQIHFRQQRK
jgi:hypothetical protein